MRVKLLLVVLVLSTTGAYVLLEHRCQELECEAGGDRPLANSSSRPAPDGLLVLETNRSRPTLHVRLPGESGGLPALVSDSPIPTDGDLEDLLPSQTTPTTVGGPSNPQGHTLSAGAVEPKAPKQPMCQPIAEQAMKDAYRNYYAQGCDVQGFLIVATADVDPEALDRASELMFAVFSHDQDLADSILETGIKMAILSSGQSLVDLPEYAGLTETFPEHKERLASARGLAATERWPLVSAPEENIMCQEGDRYLNEDTLLHEVAHLIDDFGYSVVSPTFEERLTSAYQSALASGTWSDTYMATNPDEYWAEAVRIYFGRSGTADPADGVYGPVNTAEALRAADPAVFSIVDQYLSGLELPVHCYQN